MNLAPVSYILSFLGSHLTVWLYHEPQNRIRKFQFSSSLDRRILPFRLTVYPSVPQLQTKPIIYYNQTMHT